MTPEQIQQWAQEAGFQTRGAVIRTMHSNGSWVSINVELEAFAHLVRNATLEEAAKLCDGEVDNWFASVAGQDACKDCAEEIRSLKS